MEQNVGIPLSVDRTLLSFVSDELLPGTGISPERFWSDFAALIRDLSPRNRELLDERANMQLRIDQWHRSHPGTPDSSAYRSFLEEIGYCVPEGPSFKITPSGVDDEVALIAGPQLVVPVTNARYVLNAANARWGSLYDALYGSDALGDPAPSGPYDPARGGGGGPRGPAL